MRPSCRFGEGAPCRHDECRARSIAERLPEWRRRGQWYPSALRFRRYRDAPHPAAGGGKIRRENRRYPPPLPRFFAFQQVKGLPERILAGRTEFYLNFCLDYLTKDSASIDALDRKVYARGYSVRSGDAWFQAFPQDVLDLKQYSKLEMPVLGLASVNFFEGLKASLEPVASNVRMMKVENSGHFFPAEQPQVTAQDLTNFFAGS